LPDDVVAVNTGKAYWFANYYTANLKRTTPVYLKQAFVRLKGIGGTLGNSLVISGTFRVY